MNTLSTKNFQKSRTDLFSKHSGTADLCIISCNNIKVMNINNDLQSWMQEWFEKFIGRFDRLDNNLESMSKRYNFLEGEQLLDNQDVCQLLHISKRTLQRYRSSGELPYQTIYHKTYYRESDVEAFIQTHFVKGENEEPDKEEKPDSE